MRMSTPTATMSRTAKIAIGVGVALAALVVVPIVIGAASDSGKQRPDTPAGRRRFVEIVGEKFPAGALKTEGVNDEGLVIDAYDCNLSTLNAMVGQVRERLEQFDFRYVRCPGGIKLTPPWR